MIYYVVLRNYVLRKETPCSSQEFTWGGTLNGLGCVMVYGLDKRMKLWESWKDFRDMSEIGVHSVWRFSRNSWAFLKFYFMFTRKDGRDVLQYSFKIISNTIHISLEKLRKSSFFRIHFRMKQQNKVADSKVWTLWRVLTQF